MGANDLLKVSVVSPEGPEGPDETRSMSPQLSVMVARLSQMSAPVEIIKLAEGDGTDEERLEFIHDLRAHTKRKRYNGTMWYHQPFKGLLVFYWIGTCVLLMPFYYARALLGDRPRKSWTAGTAAKVAFIRRITRLIPMTGFRMHQRDLSVVPTGLKHSEHVSMQPIEDRRIKGFIREAMLLNSIDDAPAIGFWYPKAPNASATDLEIVLHMHGGAYVLGSAYEADFGRKIFQGLCQRSGYTHLLALDYRLAMKHPFPSQMLDALAAYRYLTETLGISPARITVSGDSAGANLALALCQYIRDTETMAMPGRLLLLSPWCDPTFSYRIENGSFQQNYLSDIVDVKVTPTAVKFLLGVLPEIALHSPILSPITSPDTRLFRSIKHLFAGFPTTLILISEGERLYDEALELRDRMLDSGCHVSLHTECDAVHDWLQFDFSEPMSTSSFAAIQRWRTEQMV